jgi:hypothetical protein
MIIIYQGLYYINLELRISLFTKLRTCKLIGGKMKDTTECNITKIDLK